MLLFIKHGNEIGALKKTERKGGAYSYSFRAYSCSSPQFLPYNHHLSSVPQVAIYFRLTTRPSIGVSHVVLILWQLTQERLLGTIFPEFLLADSSCLQSLYLKVSLSGFIIYGSYFSLLEHLKYVIPLSPYTKCCCQKSHEHGISFLFPRDEVFLPGEPNVFFRMLHSLLVILGHFSWVHDVPFQYVVSDFVFNSTKLVLDCPIISVPLPFFSFLFL